ncbi:hypothetical protein ACMU_12675 [Actibacterium mucosum KCTC 23349]|uniref:Pentapeptide repeat-containing protein n=1 Tax=Actibacterium mucosum KCTC 23349 TaxID=1454373 RepID=A0A037ZL37_9RHOB|nr:pentapeptide repeat-containing protein [Actibacterium mucosum]KAJ55541.1 hypothetical protein ACMU_12675 [Actibacterium mucosum KCTC 23349]
MGNRQHLEWLLEGVEAWNARREAEEFEPDLSGFDIYEAFKDAGKLDSSGRIPLANADLLKANLRGADLKEADLREANLGEADLREADLREARLWAAKLWGANLIEADLRGAGFMRTNLEGAFFRGAKVRRRVYAVAAGNGGHVLVWTDLSTTLNLTQPQVDVMDGDKGTILPPGLTHPPDWPDPPEVPTEEPAPAPEDTAEQTAVKRVVREKLAVNRDVLLLTSASLLQQIADYRFVVYSDNQLAIDHPEHRDRLLGFLDELSANLETLLQQVPAPGEEASEEQAEEAASWFDRFTGVALPELQQFFSAEALGKASVPGGIILSFGALGAAVSGFNPLGFGAGAMVGKWITGEMKSGKAADKVIEMLDTDAPDN